MVRRESRSVPDPLTRTKRPFLERSGFKSGISMSPPDEIVVTKTDDPLALARQGLLGLGFEAREVDVLLDGAKGDSPEDLIQEALRAAR